MNASNGCENVKTYMNSSSVYENKRVNASNGCKNKLVNFSSGFEKEYI